MDVRLPKLGENAEGGIVVSLLVKEGETVTNGQTVLELENEKAVAPIPSTAAGVVSGILVNEGDRVTVGQVLLRVTETGTAEEGSSQAAGRNTVDNASSPAPVQRVAAAVVPPYADGTSAPGAGGAAGSIIEEPAVGGPPPAASPEVRRIARALNIDLRRVRASERGGRVVLADVRAYVGQLEQLARAAVARPAAGAMTSAPATTPAPSIDFSKWGKVEKKAMSSLRRTISRRMVENWNTVPHVTQFDEVDITDLMEIRKRFAGDYEKKGARLTLTSFALKAVVTALKKHPIFNSSIDEAAHAVVYKDYYHIGLAVDTDEGLIVPVIRDVDRKSLLDLSVEVNEMAVRARERKVSLEDLKGGTFTISNQGGIGGGHFTPIVNKPEVAILGLGRGAMRAVVREKKVATRLMLPLAISYDHRVIDGGAAARFVVDLAQAFQTLTDADVKLQS